MKRAYEMLKSLGNIIAFIMLNVMGILILQFLLFVKY